MICDNAVWHPTVVVEIIPIGDVRNLFKNRDKHIRFIVGIDALYDGNYPLEAHAGIDMFFR